MICALTFNFYEFFIPELSSLQSSVAGVQNNPDEILPRLMNNLIDEDPVVVLETQVMVEKLAKKDNFFNAMIRNLDFVGSIVQSLVIAMTTLNQAANALAAANNANESGKFSFKMYAFPLCNILEL